MSVTLIPKRAACRRSMVMSRLGWPKSLRSLTSCMPGMPDSTFVTSSPFCSRIFRSSPKIFSASAPLVPVRVSPTLSSMGCEKFQIAPGYFSTARSMAAIRSSFRSAKNLQRQCTLGAGKGFPDVIFDGLREVPDRARILFHRSFHGGDQFFFVLMEYRTPFVVRFQIDEILRVAESPGIGSVIRPADFGDDLCHFRKGCKNIALVGGELFAFRKTRAVRQRAPRPDRAFVQMRQKLRTDDSAEPQD